MKPIRVLVADDHRMVREGLVAILDASGECEVVAEAADGIEAEAKARETLPDVVVVDISMPRLNGVEVVRRLAGLSGMRLLVLTMHEEDEYVVHLVEAGAHGYLLKDCASEELLAAVRALRAGRGYFGPHATKILAEKYRRPADQLGDPYGALTPREREVFHLIIEGYTTKEVAIELGISAKTAENHRARILDKLDTRNTVELVRFAARRGLLD